MNNEIDEAVASINEDTATKRFDNSDEAKEEALGKLANAVARLPIPGFSRFGDGKHSKAQRKPMNRKARKTKKRMVKKSKQQNQKKR